jgi:hypothetical protein
MFTLTPGLCVHAASPRDLVVFSAMGDVPYSPPEIVQLPVQIREIDPATEFVVHVGDIKAGGSPCVEPIYATVASHLRASATPVFIVPGDNEWNDCSNVEPEEAWRLWTEHLLRMEQWWPHRFGVYRQVERQENFAFVHNEVLFIGLNIVGGRLHDRDEWSRRFAQNLDWTRLHLRRHKDDVHNAVVIAHATPTRHHDGFFVPFEREAERFAKPMLYLHGDGHRWIHDHPFSAKNVLRVQVDQGRIAPPVKITVTDSPTEPFVFDRRLPQAETNPQGDNARE